MQYLKVHFGSSETLETLLMEGTSLEARLKKNLEPSKKFSIQIEDDTGILLGGAIGASFYGCFYIDLLWVDPSVRNEGWGRKIMNQAEELARKHEGLFMAVNTMDWEALGFYQKLGYQIEFIRDGFQQQSKMYFLKKVL